MNVLPVAGRSLSAYGYSSMSGWRGNIIFVKLIQTITEGANKFLI